VTQTGPESPPPSDRETARAPLPTLEGARLVLRPARLDDMDALWEMTQLPELERWWGALDRAGFAKEVFADRSYYFAIEIAGELAGAIGFYEETDPYYRHAGVDLFLAPAHLGKGLGPEALRVLARYLFGERGHHRLIIDPAVDNERAIRAYEKVGFHRVGVMRSYEKGPDGEWHDSLLMDMLVHDLTEG
jgi:aminoglycoside 6'-N-acetyltransferase